MTLGCGAELFRVKRHPDTFSDDIQDQFVSDSDDLASLLQFASDQELLDLRAQAQRLREEKLAQHEKLIRQQLERPSSNNNNNNNRFIRFPATGEATNNQVKQINNQNIPTQTVRPSSAFTHRPRTEADFDLSSFSNKLLLDLFLKPEISRQPKPQQVEIQPIFSPPGQIVTENPVIRNNLRQSEQNPIVVPASLDDPLAILRSLQNERQASKRIEIKNQRPSQNKESQTFTTFESVPLRQDVRKNNVEQPDSFKPISNKDALASNSRAPFPNFPSTVNSPTEITTETIRAVESSKFRPRERPRRIRPFKSKVEKADTEVKESVTEEEEEEKRRQEAGIKRRKELFNSAARRRKILDSKRKQLRSRNQATTTTTVIPDEIKSTSEPNLPSPIISEAPTIVNDSDDKDEDQEVIIDEAIQAVLSRAVSGDVGKDPVVWAAVSAIYQFVDMQEQV